MARKKGIPGVSVSWKRATGLSAAKSKLSRATGVPLTRAGRQRKVGKAMGCSVALVFRGVAASAALLGMTHLVSLILT
jgi:hypothetical protein